MSHGAALTKALLGMLTLGVGAATACGTLTGCGAVPTNLNSCALKQGVLPTTAVADHTAAAPGNQQAFDVGFVAPFPAGCAVPAIVINPQAFTWVSSDPVNAPISDAAATAGIATCVGATTVPATISTSPASTIEVATLACK